MSGYPDTLAGAAGSGGGVLTGATAPVNPSNGTLWIDTTDPKNPVLKTYINGSWSTTSKSQQDIQKMIDDAVKAQAVIDATTYVQESETSTTSAPNQVARLNAAGQLDPAMIPGGVVDLTPYVKNSDLTDVSTGAGDHDKPVKLNAQGFIDPSMFQLQGGMNYKGPANPTAGSAPIGARAGDFYVATVDGRGAAGWPGLTGTALVKGEAIIFDGTNWTLIGAQLTPGTTYTRTEADNKFLAKGTAATFVKTEAVNAATATSTGVAQKDMLIKTDATGHIDPSLLPANVAGGDMTWKGYIDPQDKAAPTNPKHGDTYMLVRTFVATASQVPDVPQGASDPKIQALLAKEPYLQAIAAQGDDASAWFPNAAYKAGHIVGVLADKSSFSTGMNDAVWLAQATHDIPRMNGINFITPATTSWRIIGPAPTQAELDLYRWAIAQGFVANKAYVKGDVITQGNQYLVSRADQAGAAAINPALWANAPVPAGMTYKTVQNKVDIATSLAQFTPVQPGASWAGIFGRVLDSGSVVVWDSKEWVEITPRRGLYVTQDQYKAGLAAQGQTSGSGTAAAPGVMAEVLKVKDALDAFELLVKQQYMKMDALDPALKVFLGNEIAGTYQTQAAARTANGQVMQMVMTQYLSKADATRSYATVIDLNNKMQTEQTRADGLYETKAAALAAHTAEQARADREYIPKSAPIEKTSGPVDAGKIPKLDVNGKLDASFLAGVTAGGGGMNYKGTLDPADVSKVPAAPAQGDLWVVDKAGAWAGGWGITGNGAKGDAIIYDGTKWNEIKALVDLSNVYTKTDVDALITKVTAEYKAAIAAEVVRADGAYKTILSAKQDMDSEVNRADNTYLSKVDADARLATKLGIADAATQYLSKNEAKALYMSEATYNLDQKTVADNIAKTYETQLEAKRSHDAEVARAESVYLKKVDGVSYSTGAAQAGKVVLLGNDGQIDVSMLKVAGGMQLKGSVIPGGTNAPQFPAAGWFYLISADGTMGADWVGVGGSNLKQGSAIIYDGNIWAPISMNMDLTNFYTKQEANALYETKSDMVKQMAAEVQRADSVYQTQLQASIDLQNFRTSLAGTFASQSDVTKAVSAEQGRADGAYETKVDAADAHRAEERRADSKYIAKVDAISSASGSTDAGKVVKLNTLGKIDSTMLDPALNPATMYTPATAAADKAAALAAQGVAIQAATNTEIIRADAAYVKVVDTIATSGGAADAGKVPKLDTNGKLNLNMIPLPPTIEVTVGAADAHKIPSTATDGMLHDSFIHKIAVSTGAADANKIIATDVNGRIDNSFISIPGSMTYRGLIDPTSAVPAPSTPKVGDFYITTTPGAAGPTWTGITAPIKASDALIWEGTRWDVLAAATDVAASNTLIAGLRTDLNAALTTSAGYDTRAKAAELVLTNDLAAEVTRAKAAELVLTNDLAAEVTRAKAAEALFATVVQLNAEVATARAAELKLANDLAAEVTRADAAEKANAALITTEAARAKAAEALLATAAALAAEVTRAQTAETTLTTNLNAAIARIAALETAMAGKVNKAGDTMTGNLRVQGTIEATGDITAFKP